jgi:hypothetical protein
MQLRNARAQRGLVMIAEADENIKRVAKDSYQVRSQSGNGWYDVNRSGYGWTCTCPDFL